MGVVFLAVEEPDGQTVALKVLRKELASDVTFRRRFAHEARAARQVQHPNLVAVLSSGEHDGYPFLALEYVSGGSLVERLAKGVLGLAELLRLADDLAAGLDALHQGGIVHRDVKLAHPAVPGERSRPASRLGKDVRPVAPACRQRRPRLPRAPG
jgi:serine/threonine-protein kinase